jgi:hypothetical protein
MAESGAPSRLDLTPRQRQEVGRQLRALAGVGDWHDGLPVLLLDRCWLRLTAVPLRDLLLRLPPDASREAPELVRYRELLAAGLPSWAAQQHCWDDFGTQACREALLRFWAVQERGDRGWTLASYLSLRREYRQRFGQERPRSLPLLVLARADAPRSEVHRLHWLGPRAAGGDRAMRHTCA